MFYAVTYIDTTGKIYARCFNDKIEARIFVRCLKNIDKTTIRLNKWTAQPRVGRYEMA